MPLTYFLAQVIGLYVLIVALTMLFWKKRWMRVIDELCRPESQVLLYLIGMIALPIGLLLVIVHTYWTMGLLAFGVTLTGWLIVLKSILLLVLPPEQMGRLVKVLRLKSGWYIYVVIILILAAYMAHGGFTQTGVL